MSGSAATVPTRILLVNLFNRSMRRAECVQQATELYELTESLGNTTVVNMFTKKGLPHPATYLGPGQLEELSGLVREQNIDGIVIGSVIPSRQLHGIWEILSPVNPAIAVWDRVDLILAIFSLHAYTMEAGLQIRLAKLRHMGPRMFGMGLVLSNQSGGIGTRGIGETNLERMRRHWRRELNSVTVKLKTLETSRLRMIRVRKSAGLFSAAIVGYTNAGKTALFNALTGKRKFVKDYLFATLDATVGKVYLPDLQSSVLVSDTIGFIRDLPPSLISAFRSTLLESVHADLILHAVDLSDPLISEKILTVEGVLEELGVARKPKVYVFTKLDIAPQRNVSRFKKQFARYKPVFVSSQTGAGLTDLKRRIGNFTLVQPADGQLFR